MRMEDGWLTVPQGTGAIEHWQVTDTVASPYDSPAETMAGDVDPAFFRTRDRNIIPHEYPCRRHFAARHRDRAPEPPAPGIWSGWWFPHNGPRVDRSGFWYRATRLGCWARTWVVTGEARRLTLELATFGAAALFVDGARTHWLAPYRRNDERRTTITLDLAAGRHELAVWFGDLAERDTRFAMSLALVEGGPVTVSLPLPVPPERATALADLMDGLRFAAPTIEGGALRLLLPAPAPVDLTVTAEATGDGIAGHRAETAVTAAAGATTVILGRARDFPAGFVTIRVRLETDGFALDRALPVEILHDVVSPIPAATLRERAGQVLDRMALGPPGLARALALGAPGGGDTMAPLIEAALPPVEACHDCADFLLTQLLWLRADHADALSAPLKARLDAAALGFRYWLDEPGDDVMWYFSENHALLFHTCQYLAGRLLPDGRFARSGRSGAEQAELGRARLDTWFDAFEAHELAEWNSAPYFPIDLLGLAALLRFGDDAPLRRRAGKAIGRLLEIVGRAGHHGFLTASQGRSYEHSLRAPRSLEVSGIAWLCWGKGALPDHGYALAPLALLVRDGALVPDAAPAAEPAPGELREWRYVQGPDRLAALAHVKGPDYAIGTAVGYKPGGWGYQETLLHARLGRDPDAQIWINQPGEVLIGGYARPSYWGGSATVPRVHQHRGLAVALFEPQHGTLPFSHAWFPRARFKTLALDACSIAFCVDGALGLLRTLHPIEVVERGPTAGVELRQGGDRQLWILRLGSKADFGSLADFVSAMAELRVDLPGSDGRLTLDDPFYGTLIGHPDGRLETPDGTVDPATWTVAGSLVTVPTTDTIPDRPRQSVG
ncbi:MAG: hypothetical protein RLO50_21025 [Azospirillaceae bacterium]